MDAVGLGHVILKVSLGGLTTEDLARVQSVTLLLRTPTGGVVELPVPPREGGPRASHRLRHPPTRRAGNVPARLQAELFGWNIPDRPAGISLHCYGRDGMIAGTGVLTDD